MTTETKTTESTYDCSEGSKQRFPDENNPFTPFARLEYDAKADKTTTTAKPWRVQSKRGGDYGMGERFEIQDAGGNELFVVWDQQIANEIVCRVNSHGTLVEALRVTLPMAEKYLSGAPSHPDNAKLEDARAVLRLVEGGKCL